LATYLAVARTRDPLTISTGRAFVSPSADRQQESGIFAKRCPISGAQPQAAAEVASRRVGPAIVAAALALIAGFAALALSPVPMVSSFGLWCAADLALAALAVLLVLPSLAPRLAR